MNPLLFEVYVCGSHVGNVWVQWPEESCIAQHPDVTCVLGMTLVSNIDGKRVYALETHGS